MRKLASITCRMPTSSNIHTTATATISSTAFVVIHRITPSEREGDALQNDGTGYLAGDASIPVCRAVYHEDVIIGDNSTSGMIRAAQGQVASCPPRLAMFNQDKKEHDTLPETRRSLEDVATYFEARPNSNIGQLVWDLVQDNDILRKFYRYRHNLVLDSLCPSLAPHIVITPPDEVCNDNLITAWQNRVDFQQTEYLTVSLPHTFLSRFYAWSEGHPGCTTVESKPHISADNASVLFYGPKPVFSAAGFTEHIDKASVERLVFHQIVRTLQRQRCKAAFFEACNIATPFRRRYDSSPDFFSACERPFIWSDPAEPVLLLSQRLLGTTIIDSHCPFRVPHIMINAPPPQDPWVPWNNATNNPQDHGYGNFLIVPSSSVGVINTPIAGWGNYLSPDSFVDDWTVDPSETSQCGTPTPETPVDDEDLTFFFARPGDDIGGGMEDSNDYRGILDFETVSDKLPCIPDVPQPCQPIFSIEEDEDDLPPFDDWYKQ